MPRRPREIEAAEQDAETDALAAESITAHAAAIARIVRDPEALRHLQQIIAAARNMQARALARKRHIQDDYQL